MRKILFLILGIALTFVACSKDDNNNDDTSTVKIKIKGKTITLGDLSVTYYMASKRLSGEMSSNDNLLGSVQFSFSSVMVDWDEGTATFNKANSDNVFSPEDGILEINKEYTHKYISISGGFLFYFPEDYGVEGNFFSINSDTKITILENNPESNHLKLKFSDISLESRNDTGKIVETLNVEGDIILNCKYDRVEKY